MEYNDPRVSKVRDQSYNITSTDACLPITRQRKVTEAPKLAGRLSMPWMILHTSSEVKRWTILQGHRTDKCSDRKSDKSLVWEGLRTSELVHTDWVRWPTSRTCAETSKMKVKTIPGAPEKLRAPGFTWNLSFVFIYDVWKCKNWKRSIFFKLKSSILFCCHQTANNSRHEILYLHFGRSELCSKHKLIIF